MKRSSAAPAGEISRTSLTEAGLCLATGATAAVLVLVFFSPAFVNWQGIKYPELQPTLPEFERARYALAQVENPAAPILNPSHYAIKWRLLFPVLVHAAHLPEWLFLALPQIGCLLCLALIAWLSQQRLHDWLLTWLVTALVAALPWFFVSTGWLAYFDSWLVLAILLASFVPSRAVLLATCVLAPWIDERFVIALPVIMTVRALVAPIVVSRDVWKDLLTVAIACGPYLALRLLDWLTGEKESTGYVDTHLDEMRQVSVGTYALGLWSGFRAAWPLVVVAITNTWQSRGRTLGIVLTTVTVLTALVSLVVASDMSRTLMVLVPVVLVGAWRLPSLLHRNGRYAMAAILVANLLLPAAHVVWTRTFPIHSLPTEIVNLRDPPGWIFAPEHFRQGNQLLSEGRADEARKEYSEAIRLENRWIAPHIQRAAASAWLGDIDNARTDIDAVLAVDPRCFDALYMRSTLPGRDARQNIVDLEQALQYAPPNWPPRAQAEEALQRLQTKAP